MSNRLIQIGRVPLIPDPYVAIKASKAFSFSQARTDRVSQLGADCFGFLSAIRNGIRGIADMLERAIQIRNLSTMTDQSLADIGIRRDQLPQLYHGSGFDDIVRRHRSVWLSDGER